MIGKFLNQYNVKSLNKTRLKLEKLFKTDDFNKISLYLYKNKMEKLDKNMLKTKYVNRFIISIMVLCLYQCLHILKYKEPNKNIKNFLKYIPLIKFQDKIQENYVSKYFVFSYRENSYIYLDDYSEILNPSNFNIEFEFESINNIQKNNNNYNNNCNNNINNKNIYNNNKCKTEYMDMGGYVDVNKCLKMNKLVNIDQYFNMDGYINSQQLKNDNFVSNDYVEPIGFRARKTKSKEHPQYDVPRSIRLENNNIYDVPKPTRSSEYQNIENLAHKMLKFNVSFEDLLKENQYDEMPFTSQNYKQQLINLNRSINNLLIK